MNSPAFNFWLSRRTFTMSSVSSAPLPTSQQSYITTAVPNGHVYSYTKNYDSSTYTWLGSLTAINFAGSNYSPYNKAGVVFRETGKKLYANANPGVNRYLVGVFVVDQEGNNVSGEMGTMYIDPNCSVFAAFNGDRPTYIPTNADDSLSYGGNNLDLGNPVYTYGVIETTKGDVIANTGSVKVSPDSGATGSVLVGNGASAGSQSNTIVVGNTTASANNQIITMGDVVLYNTTAGYGNVLLGSTASSGNFANTITIKSTATADNQINTAGGIVAAQPIRCQTVTTIPGTSGAIDLSSYIPLGQVIKITVNGDIVRTITCSTNNVPGQVIYFIITGDTSSGTGSRVDFNSGFVSQSAGQFTVGNATVTMAFVSDGTTFYELSRSNALTL